MIVAQALYRTKPTTHGVFALINQILFTITIALLLFVSLDTVHSVLALRATKLPSRLAGAFRVSREFHLIARARISGPKAL